MRRATWRVGGAVLALALLAGCGGSTGPADDVPALSTALDRVDDAIVDGRYDEARAALAELVATTTEARKDGDLETSEADRILVAAGELKSALPAQESDDQGADEPEPSETGEPTTSPEPSETPDDSSGEGPGSEGPDVDKEQKKLEKEQEKLEKELEKDSKSHGKDKGH